MTTLARLLVMVALAVVVLLGRNWWGRSRPQPDAPCSVESTTDLLRVDPPALRLAEPSMREDPRTALEDRHEPRPDRRFLIALIVADCLVTERPPAELTGSFGNGEWALRYRGDSRSLPALPDFEDGLATLTEQIRRADRSPGIKLTGTVDADVADELRGMIDTMDPAEIAEAITRIDSIWTTSGGHADLLALASRGLVFLSLLVDDPLELTDPVTARAMATLAIAQEYGDAPPIQEEALLAYGMGYSSHALRLAARLPADDVVRLYITGQGDVLERVASAPGADGFTRRLSANRLQATAETEAEVTIASEADLSIPPFLPTGIRLAFEVAEVLVEDYGLEPGGPAAEFEGDVRRRTSEMSGPFLDAGTYGSYLAGAYYGDVYRDASGPASRGDQDHLANRLGDGGSIVARELRAWYANLSSADQIGMEGDLDQLQTLGPRPLERSLDVLMSALSGNDPRRQMRAAHAFAPSLDSRVDHLFMLGSLTGEHLYDPVTRERAYRRIMDLAGPTQRRMTAWMAMYDGDGEALDAMVRDTAATQPLREYALELLTGQELLPGARIRAAAEALIDDEPLSWDARGVYVDYLEESGDLDAAMGVVDEWLELSGEPQGFPRIYARTAMARLHQRSGRLDTAYDWVEPVVESGQNGAVGRAALIEAELGDGPAAMRHARQIVERYPRSEWSRAVLAEVYWRVGRPQAAAGVARQARSLWGGFQWRDEVAPSFAAAFRGRPVDDAVDAMQALRGAGIPTNRLVDLASGLRLAGRPDLAFELLSRFRPESGVESMYWVQRAYGYLVESEGPDRAAEWYREVVPPRLEEVTSMFMFSEDHPDLLWEAIPDASATPNPSWVWLMRAASFVAHGADAERERQLLDHFSAADGPPYHHIGRFLMGLESEAEVLSLIEVGDRLTEVAFYVGLTAQRDGRLEDAIEWYRVALDPGLMQEGEFRWALDRLWVLSSRARSIDRLGSISAR